MAQNFHLTGRGPRPCPAKIKCRLGGTHYDNLEEAEVGYKEAMQAEHKTFSSMRKEKRARPALIDRLMKNEKFIKGAAITALALVGTGGYAAYQSATNNEVVCTVTGKETITVYQKDQAPTQKKLVHTEQCGTMEVRGNLNKLNFDQNKIYSSLKDGVTYKFETTGINVQGLNIFPGAYSVTPMQTASY